MKAKAKKCKSRKGPECVENYTDNTSGETLATDGYYWFRNEKKHIHLNIKGNSKSKINVYPWGAEEVPPKTYGVSKLAKVGSLGHPLSKGWKQF